MEERTKNLLAVYALRLMCTNDEKCKRMTTQELIDALKNTVWADMPMESLQSALVAEAIDRLETLSTPTAKGG